MLGYKDSMSFKVKHRTAISPPHKHVNTSTTMFVLELGVGIVSLLFAYADWGNGKTMLFWPFIIVAGFCFLLVFYSALEFLYFKFHATEKRKLSETKKD